MTPEDANNSPLWSFIPLDRYAKPPELTREIVRRGFWGLWDRLRLHDKVPSNRFGQLELHPIAKDLLQQAVGEPDWREAEPALDEECKDWLKSGGQFEPLHAVVGAPYSGTCFTVRYWGADKNWRVIEPPAAGQLLTGARDWLNAIDPADESPWVIPCLEKCYLRHHKGLEPVKELLEKLSSRRRATLVACNSWAWAYLHKAVQIDLVLPAPLAPAPFDRNRLKRWFQSLTRFADEAPRAFRLPNRELVMAPAVQADESGQEKEADFLAKLAAYSRGIPGVAWSIWRHSLRFTPGPKNDDGGGDSGEQEQTIWVTPWENLNLPGIPEENRGQLALILHTLLLHNGVSNRLLPELLPGLAAVLGQDLHKLRAAGLVELEHGEWRVTALGYPAVREFLEEGGYLVDAI
ncbi:MAG: hypothetical protein QME75_11435 [Deltaproteobacteria bacterium]|nr:hypothetical protein [Deltaproteobacteria bacterium]